MQTDESIQNDILDVAEFEGFREIQEIIDICDELCRETPVMFHNYSSSEGTYYAIESRDSERDC